MITIKLDGTIGEEIKAADFAKQLDAAKGGAVTLEMNSPGGSVTEGLSIISSIKRYPGKITARIVSLAASMASAVTCACSKVIIEPSATMMMHLPRMTLTGTAADHEKAAAVLKGFSDVMAGIYQGKMQRPRAEIEKLLAEESWFHGSEAVDAGLCDEVAAFASAMAPTRSTTASARANYAARSRAFSTLEDLDKIAACLDEIKASTPLPLEAMLEARARAACKSPKQYEIYRRYLTDKQILNLE